MSSSGIGYKVRSSLQADTRRRRLPAFSCPDVQTGGGPLLVTLEQPPPEPLSDEALAARCGLSKKESRIARLLVEGRSNAEIAHRLFISPHTARRHTERILRKLGAHSRTEVVGRLLRHNGE